MTTATIFENLLRKAEYALNSKSLVLTYETFGAAKMAYELGAITKEQFLSLTKN